MSRYQSEDEIQARKISVLGEDCGQLYFGLWKECVWLHTKWREYEALFESQKKIDVLNQAAPSFFVMIQRVLLDDVVLHLARIMDPPRSMGKTNLTVKALPGLLDDQAVAQRVEERIEELEDATQFARDRRNRRLAHTDMDTAMGQHPEPLEPVTRELVNRALELLASVLNEVESAYFDSTVFSQDGAAPLGGSQAALTELAAGVYHLETWRERVKNGDAERRDREKWQV